eukprot:2430973-Amphidinium_carterae.1
MKGNRKSQARPRGTHTVTHDRAGGNLFPVEQVVKIKARQFKLLLGLTNGGAARHPYSEQPSIQ